MKKEVHIVDTTLRDGAQSPGIAFTEEERLNIARILDGCGVKIIEAGIPAMGPAEQKTILRIKQHCSKAKIAVWNRVVADDIKLSFECLPDIIHISVPVSDNQIQYKLKKSRSEVKKALQECAYLAKCYGYQISIGFEDASRADEAFLAEFMVLLSEYKPTHIRYADTVGILTPSLTFEKIKSLQRFCPYSIEFHGHNDLGMATANTLAAVQAGAALVDTTILGIGERAGNCDFLQTVCLLNGLTSCGIPIKEAVAVQDIFKKYVSDEWRNES
ncbi:MAG: homocitrate synthase [Acidaminococcaceae bacterium]